MSTTTFAAVSAVARRTELEFDADVSAAWTIGGRPNGGYLLAIAARAVTAVADQPDVLAVSAHFLRSPEPGPVAVEVERLRAGRTIEQLRGRLIQGGESCVEALFTVGSLGDGEPYWVGDAARPGPPPSAPRIRTVPHSPTGVPVAIMAEVELRLDRDLTLGPTGAGELSGSLSLPDDEAFDPISLLYAVDALPPATFDINPTSWVPTLELTAYVRARPAPGPVRLRHTASLIDGCRVDETCQVWDSAGRLVAQSLQLAGFRTA